MAFRIFTNRSRKQDMMLLSGWLFADLLLGLMAIFLVSAPPPSNVPPTLIVDPTILSPTDTQHCQGGTSNPTCTITLSESEHSEGSVNWTPSSDMGDSNNPVQFNPSTGTLSPGKPTTVTISNFPCQNGSFTINGSRNAKPVVISWQCKPTQVKLETNSVTFTLNVQDVQGLLNNSPQVDDNIRQQLRNQSLLINRSVGIAIVYGGTQPGNNESQATDIASAIYRVMQSLQNDSTFTAFQRASYYSPLFDQTRDASTVTVDVYRYVQ